MESPLPRDPAGSRSPLLASRLSRAMQGNSFQAAFLVVLILFFFPWNGIPVMGGFNAAQYFLTYADAFMPGAFVGTAAVFLIRLTGAAVFFHGLYLAALAGYAAGIASWLGAFLRSRNREYLTLLFLLFLALPSTWMPMKADFGRLDMILYAAGFFSCLWIVRHDRRQWAVPVLMILAALITEEALLMVIPVILAVAFRKGGKVFFAVSAAAAVLAAGICFILWKTAPPAYLTESWIQARNCSSYPAFYVPAELRNTLPEHLERIRELLFLDGEGSLQGLFTFLFWLTAMILPLSLWIRLFRSAGKRPDGTAERQFVSSGSAVHLLPLFFSAFIPLLLVLWGTDLNRYLTASLFAHFILLSLVLTDPEEPVRLPLPGNRYCTGMLLLILFFLFQYGANCGNFSALSEYCTAKCWKNIQKIRLLRVPGEKEYREGNALAEKKQYLQAMPRLRKSMEAEHPEGTAAFGLGVYMGHDGAPDPGRAFPLFLKAAHLGSDLGRHLAGYALIYGDGVKADPVRGTAFLRQAVRRRHLRESEYLLSRCLSEGIGTEREPGQAFVYLWLAACGNPNAACDLARHYMNGKTVPQNLREAAFWANRSGADGHPGGQYLLACLLLDGRGIPTDRPRAIRLLKASAMQGYPPASKMLTELGIVFP